MAKSVRLGAALEARLKEAASAEGVRVSESIRRAVTHHCDDVLRATLSSRLADVTGIIRTRGGQARQTGVAFTRLLRTRLLRRRT